MLRSRPAWTALVAAVAAASLGGWRLGTARPTAGAVVVTHVIDGDTVDIAGGGRHQRVRLLGVDTPETVDPRRPVGCFGPQAAAFTRARLQGRRVRLEFDRQVRDKYGRLLAYVE